MYFTPKQMVIIFPVYFSELVQNAVHKGHNANDNLQGYGVRKSEVTRWVHKIIYVIYCVILTFHQSSVVSSLNNKLETNVVDEHLLTIAESF